MADIRQMDYYQDTPFIFENADFEIGAVEIKDATSNTRAKVAVDGFGDNRLYVNALIAAGGAAPLNTVTFAGPVSVAVGLVSTLVLAANAARKGAVISNNGPNTVFLAFGVAAVVNAGMFLPPGQSLTLDADLNSTQVINGITTVAPATVGVTEGT